MATVRHALHLPPGRRDVAAALRFQARSCAEHGSPIYERVLEAVADEWEQGGPCRAVLLPYTDDPFESALALRLVGAVHRMVLAGRLPDLAAAYPSAGGDARRDPVPAFLAAVAIHTDELRSAVASAVQTNEPGRSAAIAPALALIAARHRLPLRVFELGASAGLNLRFDAYEYDDAGGHHRWGAVGSPVVFRDVWEGAWPFPPELDATVSVTDRRGCDVMPLRPDDPNDCLVLRAWIWPDHVERLARLDAALQLARRAPVVVDRADAATWLRALPVLPLAGTVTVVLHSIVWQYLGPQGRRGVWAALAEAGRRATPEAPFAWLRMEPGRGRERAELRCTTWPGGGDALLARPAFHGLPVRWLAG